jgi:PilZ domain
VVDFFLDGNKRRSHERFESNAMVQYFFKKSSMRYMDCELVNVSRSGMAIRVPASESVDSGMEVSLEITLPGSLDQITVRGTVAWFLSEETILAGIRFERLIEPEVLTRLIAC